MVRETRAREGVATEFDSEHHRAVALFQSLSACRSVWKDFDPSICEQTCRGQVRSTVTPDSANVARPRTSEIDELRCVLVGKKPLVLMHRMTPEADSILRPGPFALGSCLLILKVRGKIRGSEHVLRAQHCVQWQADARIFTSRLLPHLRGSRTMPRVPPKESTSRTGCGPRPRSDRRVGKGHNNGRPGQRCATGAHRRGGAHRPRPRAGLPRVRRPRPPRRAARWRCRKVATEPATLYCWTLNTRTL